MIFENIRRNYVYYMNIPLIYKKKQKILKSMREEL